MLRKEFEVWEIERERVYQDDLLALQDDFANRSLTFSGMREEAEKRLKQKCEFDIQTTKLKMEETETAKRTWFPNGNWRPFILSSTVSVFIGFFVYLLTKLTP